MTAGTWQDSELDLSFLYGITRLSHSGIFLEASRNRDADFGLVLPSLTVEADLYKGWHIEAGYESETVSLSVARESAEGSPDMLETRGHLSLDSVQITGKVFYDMDADTIADETITFEFPGRCWTLGVGRSRNPDRSDWKLKLEIGI